MRTTVLICVLVMLVTDTILCGQQYVCEHDAYPPPISFKAPEYDINLDLPPEQRWTRLVTENRDKIANMIQGIKDLLDKYHAEILMEIGDKLGFLNNELPSPYREEIKAIANSTGIPLAEVFLLNIAYELSALCTSIVAQDSTGRLFHVRNLDMGIKTSAGTTNGTCYLADSLRAAAVNLNWMKGGKTVFRSTNYVGYIGIITAIKQGRFTFSINERQIWDGSYIGLLQWLLTRSGRFMGFLTREMMEKANSFDEAVTMLTTPRLIAPAYFILGGNKPGQGVVITRYRETNKTDIWNMTDKTAGHWFIVETNFDHWNKPHHRKLLATKCLNEMTTKNVTFRNLYNVLSSHPVENSCTTYTSLMQVDDGLLETWIRR